MYSTIGVIEPSMIVDKYLLPIIEKEDLDLLEFRDRKGNNVLHLAIKSALDKETGPKDFLEKLIYKYIPDSLTRE